MPQEQRERVEQIFNLPCPSLRDWSFPRKVAVPLKVHSFFGQNMGIDLWKSWVLMGTHRIYQQLQQLYLLVILVLMPWWSWWKPGRESMRRRAQLGVDPPRPDYAGGAFQDDGNSRRRLSEGPSFRTSGRWWCVLSDNHTHRIHVWYIW